MNWAGKILFWVGEEEYSIVKHSDPYIHLAVFAVSNESQLRSLIRSNKEAEMKIKGNS